MKRRHLYRIILGLVALLTSATACVEPLPQQGAGDLYPITFTVQTQDDALRTKAGGPISGDDAAITSHLFMYCFDANGRYLGRYQASDLTAEPLQYTEMQTPGTFKGEIPPATARIHFVANADCPVGGDLIGMTERQVMHAPGLVYRKVGDPMSYWGYLRAATSDAFAALFDGTQSQLVWLVRDRAWIEAGSYIEDLFYDDISWVVYNGLNNGYIATFGLPEGSNEIDAQNPYQVLRHTWTPTSFTLSSEVTAYAESGGRFKTTEDDMVPFVHVKPGYKDMFVFDDECPSYAPNRVTKIIIRARYRATNNVKYFPLCITYGFEVEPIPIKRGHHYLLNLQDLPEASGYGSFELAAKATSFANGAIVDVPDDVIEVSDGSFNLRVNHMLTYPLSGETFQSSAVLIQNTVSQEIVNFEVSKQTTSVGNRLFNFSESAWLPAEEGTVPAYSNNAVTWGSELSSDLQATITNFPLSSSITFSLAAVEENTLKQSKYNLKGYYQTTQEDQATHETYTIKHFLMRNIDIYSIDRFRIQEAYAASSENHNSSNNLVLTPLGNNKYRLKFKLPGGTSNPGDHDKYPELLYPLQVKLATRTLMPVDIYINGLKQDNNVFGVQVRSTEPNTQPAMLSFQNTESQWNYQPSGHYWNFWYTYPIVSMPRYKGQTGEIQTGTVGEEVLGPEIWIDLVDIRDPEALHIIPENLGLYLYIEFFGAANAVSIDVAYVHVSSVTVHRAGTSVNGTTDSNYGRWQVRRNSTLQLSATVNPSNANNKKVIWTSSNTDYATVDEKGLVTIVASNNSTNVDITATSSENPNISNTFYIRVVQNPNN